MNGFIKLMRSDEAKELLENEPNCFLILNLIAYRAKRTNAFSALDLKIGEALLGDNGACGLTSRNYRTAKEKLQKWGFATFKTTNKGTIAKLVDNRVFDINEEEDDKQNDSQPTSDRQTTDSQTTTNKECNNEKNERKSRKKFSPPSLSEIKQFMKQSNYKDFSDSFFSFYESKGWMVGKNKMKDWKKSVSGWVARDKTLKDDSIDWSNFETDKERLEFVKKNPHLKDSLAKFAKRLAPLLY